MSLHGLVSILGLVAFYGLAVIFCVLVMYGLFRWVWGAGPMRD